MELKDKTIILTGGARIGTYVADALDKKGANLVLVYNKTKPDAKLSKEPLLVKADLSKEENIKDIVDKAVAKYRSVHGLNHMAASYERIPFDQLSSEDWDRNINVIAKSTFLLSKAVAFEMVRNSEDLKGKIITISDWSVLNRPYKDYLAYNVAKTAVIGLTKSLARELAPAITVNNIAPGPIIMPPDLSEQDNAEVMSNTPLQRWGGGDEVAKAVIYLLESDFVTGQVLFVDGGRPIA